MIQKNVDGLASRAETVRQARQRHESAKAAYEEAKAELRSAEEAVRDAEAGFSGFAWGAFGLPTPLDRFIGKPADRPATVF